MRKALACLFIFGALVFAQAPAGQRGGRGGRGGAGPKRKVLLAPVNVNTGDIAWKVPLGITDSLAEDKQKTGRPNIGGSIATAGGLVFVGATDDSRFRAFDAKTGKELWIAKLNGSASAVPSAYQGKDGKQYVVVTGTGGGLAGAPLTSDEITAFSLP